MNVLLVNPAYPQTFWSFDRVLRMIGKKVAEPPLGLLTVAALLPQEWDFKVIELKVRKIYEDEWNRCDTHIFSGMGARLSKTHTIYKL